MAVVGLGHDGRTPDRRGTARTRLTTETPARIRLILSGRHFSFLAAKCMYNV
jgi:hypothetical protein